MDPELIKLAIGGLVLLGCIGLFFGIGLALAAHKFAVESNPVIEEVLESLLSPMRSSVLAPVRPVRDRVPEVANEAFPVPLCPPTIMVSTLKVLEVPSSRLPVTTWTFPPSI